MSSRGWRTKVNPGGINRKFEIYFDVFFNI